MGELTEDEYLLADLGYQGDPAFLVPLKKLPGEELSKEEKEQNKILGSVRVKVENVLADIKIFECLRQAWRHEIFLHPVIWNISCQITNIKINMEFNYYQSWKLW